MHISIIAVGKIREPYLTQAMAEYLKRLQRYATVTIIEVAEEQVPETLSAAEQQQAKQREGERLLKVVRDNQYLIALALTGRQFTSEEFAGHLQQLAVNSQSDIVFLIGGSLGLADEVLRRADLLLSFGKLTFPHQLMRLILLEQIYRGFKIIRGEPYHK